MLDPNIAALTSLASYIFRGIGIGMISGIIVGLLTILSDAFFYNVLGLPVAMGALFPFFGLLLSPLIAGAAMAFSSVTVVGNANRLRGFKPKFSAK